MAHQRSWEALLSQQGISGQMVHAPLWGADAQAALCLVKLCVCAYAEYGAFGRVVEEEVQKEHP